MQTTAQNELMKVLKFSETRRNIRSFISNIKDLNEHFKKGGLKTFYTCLLFFTNRFDYYSRGKKSTLYVSEVLSKSYLQILHRSFKAVVCCKLPKKHIIFCHNDESSVKKPNYIKSYFTK